MSKVTLQHILDNSMVSVLSISGHAVEYSTPVDFIPVYADGSEIEDAEVVDAIYFEKGTSDSGESNYLRLATISLSEELGFDSNTRTYIATNLENDTAVTLEVGFTTKVEPEQILKGE